MSDLKAERVVVSGRTQSSPTQPRKTVGWSKLRLVGAVLFGYALLFTAISLSYFAKRRLFQSWGVPPLYFDLLIQAALAFLVTLVITLAVRAFFAPGRWEDITRAFLDAMDKVARGDFSVRLDESAAGKHPFAELLQRFNSMAEGLGKVEQLRRDFVSNVSHEIQSPLTSICGFAQALRKADLPEADRSHYLDVIEEESMRLSKLGDSLVKLAGLESEQVQLAPVEFRLDAQLRQVILAAEPLWASKKLELDVELAELSVTADPEMLGQVWTNLIHNSVKFTPDGGTLRVSLTRSAMGVDVTVSDSGIGIGEEDQKRIFDRFFKADKARRWSEGGNGLGLAIAKRIVDLHQGKIQVNSALGQGTQISVQFTSL